MTTERLDEIDCPLTNKILSELFPRRDVSAFNKVPVFPVESPET
jgi:hypothetical protein